MDRLRRQRVATFRALTGDADRLTTVARFLALLELFREGAVAFEQVSALGELTVRWTGADSGDLAISDEFDAPDAAPTTRRPDPTPAPDTLTRTPRMTEPELPLPSAAVPGRRRSPARSRRCCCWPTSR